MSFATGKLESKLADKRIILILRDLQTRWEAEDYAGVARRSRELLQSKPGHTDGLIYLARSAALTGDWSDVASAGLALAGKNPKEAFVAAGKLNRAGRSLEAAKILSELDIRDAWFDAEAAELAGKDAPLLMMAGEAAAQRGDGEAAAIIWSAGARIAPRSQVLAGKVRRLTRELKTTLTGLDPAKEPGRYLSLCREMSRLNPANLAAAVRFARASEVSSDTSAIDAWVTVLAIAPDYEPARARLLSLAARYRLESYAIASLLAHGRASEFDKLVHELSAAQDAKAKAALDKRVRLAVQKASRMKRDVDPKAYIAAWTDVLALSPKDPRAAKRVISGASHLRDYTALVNGWLAQLDITPSEAAADRAAAAALHAGEEPRVLDHLARNGLVSLLPRARLEVLYRRVMLAGRTALRGSDFDLAMACYETLALVDKNHQGLEGLRLALANGLAANARKAAEAEDRVTAVLLASEALEIVEDHPVALTMVARDLWREKRFDELVAFCKPRVKAEPRYDAVNEMLEQAAFAA